MVFTSQANDRGAIKFRPPGTRKSRRPQYHSCPVCSSIPACWLAIPSRDASPHLTPHHMDLRYNGCKRRLSQRVPGVGQLGLQFVWLSEYDKPRSSCDSH